MKFEQFQSLLKDLELYDTYFSTLQENGFDDWESVSGLNAEILQELGVEDDIIIKKILACKNSADVVEEEKEEITLIQEESEVDIDSVAPNKTEAKITHGHLVKGTSMKMVKNESMEKFLGRITHLSLNDKKLNKLDNLVHCKKLLFLNLYNNDISKIEGLDSLVNLVQLHLERNRIKKMENLSKLKKLQKLYLTNNKIECIEGLENLDNLEELYVSDQRLNGKSVTFQLESMAIISQRLGVLESEGNNIKDIAPLAYLSEVRTLKLQNNSLEKWEDLERCLACMRNLKELDLRKNPVDKIPKLRDQVFLMSLSLDTFNEKEILKTEREFLVKLYNIKGAREKGEKSPSINKNSTLSTLSPNENMQVNGLMLRTLDEKFLGLENNNPYSTVGQIKKKANLNTAKDFHSNTVHRMSKKHVP
jgi:hypothetical protein